MSRVVAHRALNTFQTVLLVFGMAAVLCTAAWSIAGMAGVVAAGAVVVVILIAASRLSKEAVLGLYQAQKLLPTDFPEATRAVAELARRAELKNPPTLYLVRSDAPNAFAVGSREDSAIALTVGLLKLLDLRELTAVLAHEISHIENGDLSVMRLADGMTRVARVLSLTGVFLLIGSIVALFFGQPAPIPWLAIAVLIFAPTVMTLAQLALSRTREFDADLDGADYSGDPEGLARALQKLKDFRGNMLEEIVMTGRRIPAPSVLRTHPPTKERVERLKALIGRVTRPPIDVAAPKPAPAALTISVPKPHYHLNGCWY